MELTAVKTKALNLIGFEVEGSWEDEDITGHDNWDYDGSVKDLPGTMGEISSPTFDLTTDFAKLVKYMNRIYPDDQNSSCGLHVHISTKNDKDYNRLKQQAFYDLFIDRATAFAKANLSGQELTWFKERLKGNNSYCCPNFKPCKHGHNGECDHECEYDNSDCYEHVCAHECDNENARQEAIEGWTSCLKHVCQHEHDDCGEDNADCDHECIDDEDCFTERGCRHDCDSDCYNQDCQHDCDADGCDGSELPHTPSYQYDNDDHESRYAHLNFHAYRDHGTLEFRLLPALNSAELTVKAVYMVANCVEEYLTGEVWEMPAIVFQDDENARQLILDIKLEINDNHIDSINTGIRRPVYHNVALTREEILECA